MGKGGQTIGYHYLFSVLFGIGRGPIDELRMIKVGEKIAWDGHSCEGLGIINKPDLFGGEKKEGGIQGIFRLQQGDADQVLPGPQSALIGTEGPYQSGTLPDIKALITSETGGLMGELRGRVTFWYDGLVASMNPYIKEWKFRIRRSKRGWHNDVCWYPEKATIYLNEGQIFAMNPAHIIYESLTNPAWGRGLPVELLDDNSFTLAANTLCEEGFGLCIVWYRKEEIGVFIQSVIDHIGATLYTDRETGKVMLKLIRHDYDPENLPIFTPESGLLDIQEDDSSSSSTVANEVIVQGHDPISDQPIEMRAHNLAAFRAHGAPSSLHQTYKGLPTRELCGRIAQRDLAASAAGLRKFKVFLDRRGFRLHPGAVFRIQAPTRGIADVILRAGEIDDGKMSSGQIAIDAVQDVFGLPIASFVTPVENTWSPPSDEAVPADIVRIDEAGYRQAYLTVGENDANTAGDGDSYLMTLAAKPSVRTTSYDILSRAEGETNWSRNGEHFFTGTATTITAIDESDTTFSVENIIDFPSSLEGRALLVGDEVMRIDDYNSLTGAFTVARGAADTWPEAHPAGTRVWIMDDDPGNDERLYAEEETVEVKILTRTWSDALESGEADTHTVTMGGRIARPYPPADVEVDAESIFDLTGLHEEPVLTWVGRNRLTQADQLVGFYEAAVTPEDGTTYTVRIFNLPNAETPVATHTGITSGWTYDSAQQAIDGTDTQSTFWFELVAVRDGIESWKPRRFPVAARSGWGYNWGFNWGGDPS